MRRIPLHPITVATLVQLVLMAMVVGRGGQKFDGGTYLPVGVAVAGITFAAMTLVTGR